MDASPSRKCRTRCWRPSPKFSWTLSIRESFERHQITIYFGAVGVALVLSRLLPGSQALEVAINPTLAFMLYVTFLQVPLEKLPQSLGQLRFLSALLLTNFALVPLLVYLLIQIFPGDSLSQLGVLLVLLCPCIDYVVTFSHLGGADARLLLAATPLLLLIQMLLLHVYLRLFLGAQEAQLVQITPFVQAFLWLILVPLGMALLTQLWASKSSLGARLVAFLGLLPVPVTALVLLVVVASVVPQLGWAAAFALRVVPIYITFALVSPALGWQLARRFGLDQPAARAVAFSAGTRNSLVVLPLALAVPGAIPVLPVVIVTQTLVELASEMIYIKVLSRWGNAIE